ncbi:hypothetical protein CsatA_021693 [Cannabis sativa]
MGSTAPIAIGTRGTVGSLVRKEIEYFTKLEVDRHGNSRKPRGPQILDMASTTNSKRGNNSWPSFKFLMIMSWKRRKQRSPSRSFIPSLCSASEVDERNRFNLNGAPSFSYRILRDDLRSFDL